MEAIHARAGKSAPSYLITKLRTGDPVLHYIDNRNRPWSRWGDYSARRDSLYTLPAEERWKLIINKQTGQWGIDMIRSLDLARVDLNIKKL